MIDRFPLGEFSLIFVYGLAKAILRNLVTLATSDQRRLIKSVRVFHSHLQAIIINAEKNIALIQNADKHIEEDGEDKFAKIVKENFKTQLLNIHKLVLGVEDNEISSILTNIDDNLKLQLYLVVA